MTFLSTQNLYLSFDGDRNQCLERINFRGTEFLRRDRACYGGRWSAFINGEELSQSDIRTSTDRKGWQRTKIRHLTTKGPTPPSTPFDSDPNRQASNFENSSKEVSYRFTPEYPEEVFPEGLPVRRVSTKVNTSFLGNEHITRYQTTTELERETSGQNSPNAWTQEILGEYNGTQIPHCIISPLSLYLDEAVSDQAYIFNAGTKTRAVRTTETEIAPSDGGPIIGSGDGNNCIGIYQFTRNYPAFGFQSTLVRWRQGTDTETGTPWNELSVGDVSRDGRSIQAGSKSKDFYIVLGTADEVEKTFIALHNYFTVLERNKTLISLESGIGLEPLVL